jgi:hypothetical protein
MAITMASHRKVVLTQPGLAQEPVAANMTAFGMIELIAIEVVIVVACVMMMINQKMKQRKMMLEIQMQMIVIVI